MNGLFAPIPARRFPEFSGEWIERKVKECFEERNELFPESSEYPLMAFIAGKGVSEKGERYDRSALVKDASNKKYKRTELNDFIYSSNNLESGSIGLNRYGKASISTVYSIFKVKDGFDPNFLGTILTQKSFISEMIKYRQGVVYGQWKIPEKEFLDLSIRIPSFSEQKKIANFLETEDQMITAQEQKVEALKLQKKGLMHILFPETGANTPVRRFPGFSGGWREIELGQVCSVNRGVRITRKDLNGDGIYPVFQNTNSPLGYYHLYNVKENNPFVIIGGSAGAIGYCKRNFWAADDCAYFGDSDELDKYFLFSTLLLHSVEINNNVRGGNIPRLDRKALEGMKVLLPGLQEQKKIGACLSEIDDMIAKETEMVGILKKHKIGLLQQILPQPNYK
jgi:type I restriction enzyme S subunit